MARGSMRLDVRGFGRTRLAGVVVVAAAALAALIAFASLAVDADASKAYVEFVESGYSITSSKLFSEKVLDAQGAVAVMFRSETCPTCERMYPYWRVVEEKALELGFRAYDVKLTRETSRVFDRYGVHDLPTFIVFYDGEPVARYVGAFTPDDGNITRAMIEWVAASIQGSRLEAAVEEQGPQAQQQGQESSPFAALAASVAAALAAGVVASLSPCVLPLLVTNSVALARRGRGPGIAGCLACSLSAFAGVMAVGVVFLLASSLLAEVQTVVMSVVAVAVVAAGVSSLLGLPVEMPSSRRIRSGSLAVFCGLYGLLALQCSLPMVVGALLLVLGSGGLGKGLVVLLAFSLGLSLPLSAALYLGPRMAALAGRVEVLERAGGAVMVLAGVVLLAHSLGLI